MFLIYLKPRKKVILLAPAPPTAPSTAVSPFTENMEAV